MTKARLDRSFICWLLSLIVPSACVLVPKMKTRSKNLDVVRVLVIAVRLVLIAYCDLLRFTVEWYWSAMAGGKADQLDSSLPKVQK